MQCGATTVSSIAGGGIGYAEITFDYSFKSVPKVFAALNDEGFKGAANAQSVNEHGATIRVDNMGTSTSSNALKVVWFAVVN